MSDIIGAWAPGNQPQVLPPGIGLRVNAGSRAAMQVHYHVNGTRQTDRTRVGLFFNRDPIQKDLRLLPIINEDFVIPPGAARHTVTASVVIPNIPNLRAISILPHMHLLGREIKLDAIFPDGSRRPLIYIDDWDFQWQGTYYYREPIPPAADAHRADGGLRQRTSKQSRPTLAAMTPDPGTRRSHASTRVRVLVRVTIWGAASMPL